MDSERTSIALHRAVRAIAGYGLGLALCLSPPIFRRFFALGEVRSGERIWLWALAAAFATVSALVWRASRRPNPASASRLNWAAAFFGVCALVSVELGFRGATALFFPRLATELNVFAAKTYHEDALIVGHPFLNFTGRPRVDVLGKATGSPYNNLGFTGRDFVRGKTAGVVRIAALGGSTTMDGYPGVMEEQLNLHAEKNQLPWRFEVFNFGMMLYGSAQSVVNYTLNVQDYQPDYLVILDGWNEYMVRGARPESFRSDYSHEFTEFKEPSSRDRWAIRSSALYRLLKLLRPVPHWLTIYAAVKRERPVEEERLGSLEELKPFRRNLQTILDLAAIRGTRTVLLTQPFSRAHPRDRVIATIEQTNRIVRGLFSEYGAKIVAFDLDEAMSKVDPGSIYVDQGHVNEQGRAFKANLVGEAILADLKKREPRRTRSLASPARQE